MRVPDQTSPYKSASDRKFLYLHHTVFSILLIRVSDKPHLLFCSVSFIIIIFNPQHTTTDIFKFGDESVKHYYANLDQSDVGSDADELCI